jgi:rhodanese-related sulfurtransferase
MNRYTNRCQTSFSKALQALATSLVVVLVIVLTLGSCSESKKPRSATDDASTQKADSKDDAVERAVTPPAGEEGVTIQELKSALDNQESIFLLDVRSRAEFVAGHVAEVDTLIPHTEIVSQEINLPVDKSQYIYVICRSGRRSGLVTKWLRENGYSRAYNVTGGMLAWDETGYPVAR